MPCSSVGKARARARLRRPGKPKTGGSGIQSFDEGGVNATAAPLRGVNDRLDQRGITLLHTPLNLQLTSRASLDDLDNADVGPGDLTRCAALTGTQRGANAR